MPALSALAASAIIAGVGGLGRGVAAFGSERAKANALYGESQEERLRELQRMEEMNALGLTDNEQSVLSRQMLSPVQAAQREKFDKQAALMGSVDSSTAAMNRMMLKEEQEDRLLEKASTAIATADLAEQRRQEDEMRKLEGAESASKAIKDASWYQLFGGVASGASDAFLQQMAFESMATSRGGVGKYSELGKLFFEQYKEEEGAK